MYLTVRADRVPGLPGTRKCRLRLEASYGKQEQIVFKLSLATPGDVLKDAAKRYRVDTENFRKPWHSLKRKAAPGVDGVTWQEHEDGLEDRLTDLHERVHRGAYRAAPLRRVYIEKADGRQRPLAVPAT